MQSMSTGTSLPYSFAAFQQNQNAVFMSSMQRTSKSCGHQKEVARQANIAKRTMNNFICFYLVQILQIQILPKFLVIINMSARRRGPQWKINIFHEIQIMQRIVQKVQTNDRTNIQIHYELKVNSMQLREMNRLIVFKTNNIIRSIYISLMQCQDILLIFLGTFIVIGYGYSMDMPQALELPLRGAPYNFTSIEYNYLYFATYLPIMLTNIPLGIILDKYPLQITVIVIALSSFIAEILIAMCFDFRPQGYIYIVYFLRAIVGMAGQCAFTMQGFVLARYASQHFQMLIGFGMCVPYLFDAVNAAITPIVYNSTHSISLPWYIASGVDFLAVIAALIISIIVTKKQKRKKEEIQRLAEQQGQEQAVAQEQFSIDYLWQLPRIFWLIIAAIVVNQITFGMYSNLNDLIVSRFQLTYVTTGELLLIPFTFGAVLSIICGRILTVRPYLRRLIILISSLLVSLGFAIIYFLPNNASHSEVSSFDYLAIITFFVIFSVLVSSIYTVIYSAIPLLADQRRLGTVLGVAGMAIGLGESITPIMNGLIQNDSDLPGSYQTLSLIYMFASIAPIVLALVIYCGPYSAIDSSYEETHNKGQLQNN